MGTEAIHTALLLPSPRRARELAEPALAALGRPRRRAVGRIVPIPAPDSALAKRCRRKVKATNRRSGEPADSTGDQVPTRACQIIKD